MRISKLSKEIFLSRDAIRSQIIEEIKESLDLLEVDLTKSSFLSYIINILSTLTSNILFYQISVYREFFLTKAQLVSSVNDGAASIGYNPDTASSSTLPLILTFPFRFTFEEIQFEIPEQTEFVVDSIKFVLNYSIKVIVTANSMVQVYKYKDGVSEIVPVSIIPEDNTFNIMLTVDQMEIEKFEFSIGEESTEYRFSEYPITTRGQISDIKVVILSDGDTIEQIYTRFSSIYLMSADDYGFVIRKNDNGYSVYFGNGLIGKQPPIGGKIYVTIYTTLGTKGNIIKGIVKSTPRITAISNDDGTTFQVNYDTINPDPGMMGKDEPNLEEIKYMAIGNLTALHRLVSENDYMNVGVLMANTPLANNTYPVLKRSDIRTNEIQLFSLLKYNGSFVPTENIYIELDSTANMTIDKYETFVFNNEEFITPFDLLIDPDLEVTKYRYITNSVKYNLSLISTNVSIEDYVFFGNYLLVQTYDNRIRIRIYFQTMEVDYDIVTCSMAVTNTMIDVPMIISLDNVTSTINQPSSINDLVTDITTLEGYFEVYIEPYSRLPEHNETYYFTFTHPTLGQLNQYSVNFTFRKNLDQMMLSNTVVDENTGKVTVYDIPVVSKKYYDEIDNKEEFEYHVFQRIIDNIDFKNIRMITDFINIKFANTSQYLKNMLLNVETRISVDYIGISSFDHEPLANERFIVNNNLSIWDDIESGYIGICTKEADSTSASEWSYVKPEMDDIIYAKNTELKYIYTGHDWIEPIFEIPLIIEADVKMLDNYSIDKQAFIDKIKTQILSDYNNRMVCQSYLNRSELISTIQTIEGVDHCRLIKPVSNIFYNFRLEELTSEELLHYTPELLYFTEDNITIRLVQ